MVYIIAMIILLGLCVFVHELGHLLGGKLVGIKARTFSIGFGKGIIKKEWNGTTWQIAPIPLGGFCSFYGEDAGATLEGKSYEFLTAAPWRRIVTVLAGPLFNLFFGIILFFIMNLVGYTTDTNKVVIPDELRSGEYVSPAFTAGIQNGDKVIAINGKKIVGFLDIQNTVVFSDGKPLVFKIERGTEVKEITVTPKKFGEKSHYLAGLYPYGNRVLVRNVIPNEQASESGILEKDEIKALNGKVLSGVKEFHDTIRANTGKKIDFTIERRGKEIILPVIPREREVFSITLAETVSKKAINLSSDTLGLFLKDDFEKGTVLLNGDKVKTIDILKEKMNLVRDKDVTIGAGGKSFTGKAVYQKVGYVGIEMDSAPERMFVRFGVGEAFVKALVDPINFIVYNLKGIGMLISGKLNVRENVSGPIRIAKIAGDTLYYQGISVYIVLMAKISIVLMVMNLLPLPAVDGSHVIFYTIEWIRRKPLNQKIMERIQFGGFVFIILLSVFVIFNDITFLPVFDKISALFK
jgi:regulator of sigma E protease